jgi:phospholipid/cholesterol/gamma-HCH transport system substrate-binding protein
MADVTEDPAAEAHDAEEEEGSRTARIAALAAIFAAIAVVAYLLLFAGSTYTVTAEFQNASQVVAGNRVEVAGVSVGTVKSISLGDNGQALVKMEISDSSYTPLHRGTTATVRSNSLSGIANRYIQLNLPPAARTGEAIASGSTMSQAETVSEVDLDQLFNSLSKSDIRNFKNVIKGFARSYEGVGPQANRGFHYLNPFLSTSRRVFAELNLDQRAFENLIVDAAQLTGALAQRAPDISALIHNLNLMMGAIGRQSSSLAAAVGKLPPTLRLFDTTFVNLRATLTDLTPLVNASKPVAIKLKPFFVQLRAAARDAVPTVRDLDTLVSKPGPNNDLTELTKLQVPLAHIAIGPVSVNGPKKPFSLTPCPSPDGLRCGAFPETRFALQNGLHQLAFFRPYLTIEGVSGWFNDFGPLSGVYDANGGVPRISTTFNTFSFSTPGVPNLIAPPQTPVQTYAGLTGNQLKRCPGANERDPGDGSTPFTDGGTLDCNSSEVPTGP